MSFIEILKVLVFGIVEGFTEWLPISSMGHLILVEEMIHLEVTEEFLEMFKVVIRLGAVLAVIVLYFRKLNPFDRHKRSAQRKVTVLLWAKILTACLPAVILGGFLDDWVKGHLTTSPIIAMMLLLYGTLFIVLENRSHNKRFTVQQTSQISFAAAVFIGCFQVLALIPGTSRPGALILGAMLIGCSRAASAEFSFFLGIPMIFGSILLKLIKLGFPVTWTETVYLMIGMVAAFIVSVYSIKFLLEYIRSHDYKFFGYYQIILGIIVIIYFGIKAIIG